jgi:hypothetical protein
MIFFTTTKHRISPTEGIGRTEYMIDQNIVYHILNCFYYKSLGVRVSLQRKWSVSDINFRKTGKHRHHQDKGF